jgi:hypothetical protein
MSWSIGKDPNRDRDVGYGVPAYCDHPQCWAEIDRGLAYCCGDYHGGDEKGCGLYFCAHHLSAFGNLCPKCARYDHRPYKVTKPEHPDWIEHKLTDESWQQWRDENPDEVARMRPGTYL